MCSNCIIHPCLQREKCNCVLLFGQDKNMRNPQGVVCREFCVANNISQYSQRQNLFVGNMNYRK